MSGAEIKEYLDTQVVPKVEASFVIDTLKYLHKGGRCSSVAALGSKFTQAEALHRGAKRTNACRKKNTAVRLKNVYGEYVTNR